MKLYFEDMSIDFGGIAPRGRGAINEKTSQIDFINRHRRDIESEIGAFKQLIKFSGLYGAGEVDSYLEVFGGCGFTLSIALKYLNPRKIVANDNSVRCVAILAKNFLSATITGDDAKTIGFHSPFDFAFFDFNTFSTKKIDEWDSTLTKAAKKCRLITITDTAIYGKKFGAKNLKSYGVKQWPEYYEKLSDEMNSRYSMTVTHVVFFKTGSAALVLLSHNKNGAPIQYSESTPIPINETKGLFQ